MKGLPVARLKPGKERSLLRRHPWVFSGAVASMDGNPRTGDAVAICDSSGNFLCLAAFSPQSQIRLRVWTFDVSEKIDADFFHRRIQKAVNRRMRDGVLPHACRLINAEADLLPGLIVDKYGDYLVCQFLSAGVERWKDAIVQGLEGILQPPGIYERSDAEVRLKEGLLLQKGLLAGNEPPELIEIWEGDYHFLVDVRNGHKTGFYLDQAENRKIVAEYTHNREILNCFSYTGGFAVAAVKAGAKRVINLDTSGDALELASKNLYLNWIDSDDFENLQKDVFHCLRTFRDRGMFFDMIILDPPKFAENQHQLEKAARGYKDINLLAFKLLKPGGILVTFSCSGLVSAELFQKIVADAALDARREARIQRHLFQASDHAVLLSFPEGQYLKGLVCEVE
ncbi:MAG: class I SAM-dependent methyltransferase [Dissulfuribacterales bacterium]